MTENDYCLLYDIASKRITDLEKENAELNNQLTKAKEIIKDCIHILKHSGTALDWRTVINKAEQFIKEIEK